MLVGIDIVDIARLKQVINRTPRFLERVFTPQEIEYCYRKRDPYPSLAARFAAREALRKLDALFYDGARFHDSEVIIDSKGKPQLVLHGALQARAAEAAVKDISLSLSHSREQAIAVIVASKG